MRPLDTQGFAHESITILADETQPLRLPTKENIVGPTCKVLPLYLPLHFAS